MNIIKDLWAIKKLNNYHGRIVVSIIYLEYVSSFRLFFHILRRLIIQHLYNSEISPVNFRNARGIVTLRLPHPYLIIVHPKASLGENCTLFHNVTIGTIERGVRKAAYIGDNVYIGCSTTILGGVKIADNSKIGAMSVVLRDVSEGETVVGIVK